VLGFEGYSYPDLFAPVRLAALANEFEKWFLARAPEAHAQFAAYRKVKGEGMKPEDVSEALIAAAPHVSSFVGKLFGVEAELAKIHAATHERKPLWSFKRDFAKKRVLSKEPGKAWAALGKTTGDAQLVAEAAMLASGASHGPDEELLVACAVLAIWEVDDIARKVKKAGGAQWSDELATRGKKIAAAVRATGVLDDAAFEDVIAKSLDAVEAHLANRYATPGDPLRTWATFHQPHVLDYDKLVQLRRPSSEIPEMFVGPDHDRRERGEVSAFQLTDRRVGARGAEDQIDYCILCHNRDKDSCSKGLLDAKTKEVKKNPLGVSLDGCPLEEKISEMHTVRGEGDPLGALAIIIVDNPMCAGTGHRICNDCMKSCIFQKQDPVNIPEVETRVLTEVLELPWGLEIYGFLTRWNPLNVQRPYALPYNGKNVLVVGLGPAGYTLAHHLSCEGFGVVAVDGLKVEPLPVTLVGDEATPPLPVYDFNQLHTELDERILLGFGGVSEYGITVRWDKNFLTVVYVTLARNGLVRLFGGVRFGGTLTLEDAWALGFDHVALAAGAGKPTIIEMKNNLTRGVRKASDFLMALQLTGAYKKSSIANLQVSLPAIVIGGGLTAIDTATELLAYYVVQIEKTAERFDVLESEKGTPEIRAMFDEEEWEMLQRHLAHAKELAAEREKAKLEKRPARIQPLLDSWGGVSLVYRKRLQDSPAYRLNHEEVGKSLEEGVHYIEEMSPLEALLDERGHVRGVKFERKDKSTIDLPARTVCVAAGTSPNVTYEREHSGNFELDKRGQFYSAYAAKRGEGGKLEIVPSSGAEGFFTSYLQDGHLVSFYGDNHPYFAGSVVKAMASAKTGYPKVRALFPELDSLDQAAQVDRDAAWKKLAGKMEEELRANIVEVNRLTPTIVEVVVHAPLAARKFRPGQFYRLQNFESRAPMVDTTRLAMEGLALTGAWVDEEKGLMGTIVLEMGGSSRLCAALEPGEPVILMGPTGTPTEIESNETVMLCGGGLGNAVLFSIARAFKAMGSKVLYFAGYKHGEDLFKQDEVEKFTDEVIWCTDIGAEIEPRRPQDKKFRGNIVQAMVAYAKGELGKQEVDLKEVGRVIAIGSDRMMAAVKDARHGPLGPYLMHGHRAIGSINSPMQCMMKEICAQCLQKHNDPATGKTTVVFSCANQ
ncbi:MAG: pyridine nucleotide-disulfide oxidoreductase, partial [Polyangiaceae bacterium]